LIELEKNNHKEKAKENFEKALHISPYYTQCLLGMGNLYYDLEDYTAAEEYYRKAYEFDTYDIQVAICLANTLVNRQVN
jgi:Tfp pilus assembly protein PilF